MSRIEPNKTPDAQSAAILDGVRKQLGVVPNIFSTLAHSPAALGFYAGANAALASSKLTSALREQIALTVAGANRCNYCASAHTALGKMHKLDDIELALNLRGQSGDPKIQAVLTFARRIVELRGHVTDADLKAVRAAGFGDAEIIDIVAVTALNIFTNYFNHIADTDVDFPLVSTADVAEAA